MDKRDGIAQALAGPWVEGGWVFDVRDEDHSAHFAELMREGYRAEADRLIAYLWKLADDPLIMNELMDTVTSIPLGASDARIAYATRGTLLTALIGPRPTERESTNAN